MELLETILVTIVTLGVLVTFHEYGHFWVARRNGIKVLRFSVGFGKPLLRWHDKQGTEYVIAALPLGGYVKMLDEREGHVAPSEQEQAFNQKPVLARIAVVAAGPIANLLLALFVYWALFMSGERGVAPVVGEVAPGSLAAIASLEQGQEIIAVDGQATPTRQALSLRLLDRLGETGTLQFTVQYPGSDLQYNSEVELENWLVGEEQPDVLKGLGLTLYRPQIEKVLDTVMPGTPADRAGLKVGDEIIQANGRLMESWQQWVDYVRARPEQEINLRVERDGEILSLSITPERVADAGEEVGRIGAGAKLAEWPPHMLREYQYTLGEALVRAGEKTVEVVSFTLSGIKKMLFGQISAKNLSGPITIAKVASDSAEYGWQSYLSFLALLSVSLGVLNLLPIPVLDGGHLLYYSIELLKGSPLSDKAQIAGQQFGMFILIGVMLMALYNDLMRL